MIISAEEKEQPAGGATVQDTLARYHTTASLPQPDDHVLFLRGVPVVPWIPRRAAEVVWSAWLAQLRALWERWPRTADTPWSTWEAWCATHVHSHQVQGTREGVDRLALLLAERRPEGTAMHVVGHSVGGAAALTYLAKLRSGSAKPPAANLRSVITIDAAIAGLASIWTGTRAMLGTSTEQAFSRLGAWADEHGISVLTACNERDIWSHRMVADLPYVGFWLGARFGTLGQISGRTHILLRLTPQFVRAIWALPDHQMDGGQPAGERSVAQE